MQSTPKHQCSLTVIQHVECIALTSLNVIQQLFNMLNAEHTPASMSPTVIQHVECSGVTRLKVVQQLFNMLNAEHTQASMFSNSYSTC
jgi:hypothetical protein